MLHYFVCVCARTILSACLFAIFYMKMFVNFHMFWMFVYY